LSFGAEILNLRLFDERLSAIGMVVGSLLGRQGDALSVLEEMTMRQKETPRLVVP